MGPRATIRGARSGPGQPSAALGQAQGDHLRRSVGVRGCEEGWWEGWLRRGREQGVVTRRRTSTTSARRRPC
ncbi:MAG: hypothetical protein DI571_02870 [Arsenicicoccus sp.]|nr:MAG: hypothetical protein DI571_02870 [Arsenicicoccus sp.]